MKAMMSSDMMSSDEWADEWVVKSEYEWADERWTVNMKIKMSARWWLICQSIDAQAWYKKLVVRENTKWVVLFVLWCVIKEANSNYRCDYSPKNCHLDSYNSKLCIVTFQLNTLKFDEVEI